MISSAPDLKRKLQKLNILGQSQIIQPVPIVSDCLGHFVPIYCLAPPSPWAGTLTSTVQSGLLIYCRYTMGLVRFP